MPSFGYTTTAPNETAAVPADQKYTSQFTAPEDGLLTSMNVLVHRLGTDISAIRLLVYQVSGGIVTSLLAKTQDLLLAADGTTGWVTAPVISSFLFSGGQTLAFACQFGAAGGQLGLLYDSSIGLKDFKQDTFSDGPHDPYQTGVSTNGTIAVYATYTNAASVLQGITTPVIPYAAYAGVGR